MGHGACGTKDRLSREYQWVEHLFQWLSSCGLWILTTYNSSKKTGSSNKIILWSRVAITWGTVLRAAAFGRLRPTVLCLGEIVWLVTEWMKPFSTDHHLCLLKAMDQDALLRWALFRWLLVARAADSLPFPKFVRVVFMAQPKKNPVSMPPTGRPLWWRWWPPTAIF